MTVWIYENWSGLVQAIGATGTFIAAIFAWRSVKTAQRIRESELAMDRLVALQKVVEEFDKYALAFRTEGIRMRSVDKVDSIEFSAALRSCVEELPLCRGFMFQHIPPDYLEVNDSLSRSRLEVGPQVGDPEWETDEIMAMRGELLGVLDQLRHEAMSFFGSRAKRVLRAEATPVRRS